MFFFCVFRYKSLLPSVEVTCTRSSMVVRCFDYRQELERNTEWLRIAEDKLAVSYFTKLQTKNKNKLTE